MVPPPLNADTELSSASPSSSRSSTPSSTALPNMVTTSSRLEHRKPLGWPAILANCAARFLLWSLFAYILCLSVVDVQPGKGLFSWHPPLLTLAFVLMSESMMCFSGSNLATHQLSYAAKVHVHWLLQALAAACTAVGFLVVCVHKFRLDKTHFGTWHAQYGLGAIVCTVATGTAGLVAKYGVQLRHRWRPLSTKIVHAALALANYKLMAVAIALGMFSSWFGKHGTQSGLYGCCASVVAVTVYVGWKPTQTLVARVRSAWLRAYEL